MTATQLGRAGVARLDRAAQLRRNLDALPASTWIRCPGCRSTVAGSRIAGAGTCPDCGHHFPLLAEDRLVLIADPGSIKQIVAEPGGCDPLNFTDRKPYRQRLSEAVEKFGRPEAAIAAELAVQGHDLVAFVLDFAYLGGSMGAGVGALFCKAVDRAIEAGTPLVSIASSGGARMQEGIFSLMQMARTAGAVTRLNEAGLLYVSVLADPCFGGVSASFASLGDVVVAEPRARAGFAGRSVIEQTLRQQLPADFQTAESLLRDGHIDAVVPRVQLRELLGRLCRIHSAKAVPEAGLSTPFGPAPEQVDAWRSVGLARRADRLQTQDFIDLAIEDFVELRGDRQSADDRAIVAGVGLLSGQPLMIIGHQRGHDTTDRLVHRFGMAEPAGYRKVQRCLAYASRLGLPVLSLIDTPGAYPGQTAEQQNQSGAIARCIAELCALAVSSVALVLGEGGSGGALALGVADRLLMMQHSTLSVISPEGCATILYGDSALAEQAAQSLRVDATSLFRLGVIDEIVAEPVGGAHTDWAATATAISSAVLRQLDELAALGDVERRRRRAELLSGDGHRRQSASLR